MNRLLLAVAAFVVVLVVQIVSGTPSSREPASTICQMPEVRGFCRAMMVRWAYDPVKKECYQFNYGGCGGNENNFRTQNACMDKCAGV